MPFSWAAQIICLIIIATVFEHVKGSRGRAYVHVLLNQVNFSVVAARHNFYTPFKYVKTILDVCSTGGEADAHFVYKIQYFYVF